MILPIYAAPDRMDPALIEAGKDLYGTRWNTFRHVTMPATFQGVLAGTVLVFLPAVGTSSVRLGRPRHVHDREPDPAAVPRRGELAVRRRLTTVLMAFLAIWMVLYLRPRHARRVRRRRELHAEGFRP